MFNLNEINENKYEKRKLSSVQTWYAKTPLGKKRLKLMTPDEGDPKAKKNAKKGATTKKKK